jgi:predicted  nucleic acid-binding Zn-ribbon protein
MTIASTENTTVDEVLALNARISALESENSSLKDDIAELERELEYISRAKHTKRKRFEED